MELAATCTIRLTKIININTTNVGIAAFAGVFYICMRMLSGKIDLLSLVLISAWGIIGLACLPITTMYIVVVLLGGFVATVCFILLRQSDKVGYILACWLVLQRQISRRLILVWFGRKPYLVHALAKIYQRCSLQFA